MLCTFYALTRYQLLFHALFSVFVQITHTALRERSWRVLSRALLDAAVMFCQIYSTTAFILCSGSWTDSQVLQFWDTKAKALSCGPTFGSEMRKETIRNCFSLFVGEPLHGYRVCIQAILQDKPKIATQNLPEVSQRVSLMSEQSLQITASLHSSALKAVYLFVTFVCTLSKLLSLFCWPIIYPFQ